MSISSYLNTTGVTLASVTGSNSDGAPTYGAAATIRCRYESTRKLLRLQNGEAVVSAGRLFVEASQAVAINDKVTYGGNTYRVLEIHEEFGFSSVSHKMVLLGG